MADAITIKALQDASLDAKSLEDVVNGDEAKQVTTRLGETYPSVKKAIKTLFENGGLPASPFITKSAMEASSLVDGDYALVTDDTDDVNGIYIKEGAEWVKSEYDPTALLEMRVDTDTNNSSDIVKIVDSGGKTVYKATSDAKHYFVGLESDLKTEIGRAYEIDASDDAIFKVKDRAKRTTLYQDTSGDLHLPRVGNATEVLLSVDMSSNNTHESVLSQSYAFAEHAKAEVLDRIEMPNVPSVRQYGELVGTSEVDASGIFSYNSQIIRIPALTRVAKNKYLLFFEGRETPEDTDNISSGCATLTVNLEDNTVAISDYRLIHQSFVDGESKLRTFMNPCGVKTPSGKVVCFYVRRHTTASHELYYKTSTDDGKTWSDHTDVSSIYKDKHNAVIPCSQGIVKRFGNNKGRIIFPAWRTSLSYSNFESGFIYSDDDGVTWHLGDFIDDVSGNEVQCAEDVNGDIYFAYRFENTQENNPDLRPKRIARYDDKTHKFEKISTETALSLERVMSALIQNNNVFEPNATPKLFLATCWKDWRKGLVVNTTYNGFKSFKQYRFSELENTMVSYVAMDNIDEHHKLMVWESNNYLDFTACVISTKTLIGE